MSEVDYLKERLRLYAVQLMMSEQEIRDLTREVEFFKSTSMLQCPCCRAFNQFDEKKCKECDLALKP